MPLPAKQFSNSFFNLNAVSSSIVCGAESMPLGRLAFAKKRPLFCWIRLPTVALIPQA
jgi:hypothetical protein